ncbi:unnamed protein product [Gemmata massiliana]|uniref:Uncharacterized protein n=1 Tax=Gemmata massiliana TaxID=1210884 RepID=A0A6P2D3V0_9BACT|nr:unnamed protein product [Gemmata massiliana]
MTELTLTFTRSPRAELLETRFEHPRLDRKVVARLGAYDQSFKWTAGVQALSTLLLQTAAWHRRSQLVREEPPCLEGRRPSAAASLNDALTSRPQRTCDMFGEIGGRPFLGHLIKRWNADFNTSPNAPVRLWLEPAELPPARIRVCIDNDPLEDPEKLWTLAEDVERQWRGKAKGVAQSITVPPVPDHPAGVRLNVSANRVLIELVLDRPFESFGPDDEEELLRAIRVLLRTSRELPVRGKRPGSVILTLELSREEARELAAAVARGALANFGATAVRPVSSLQQEPRTEKNESPTGGPRPDPTGSRHVPVGARGWRSWLVAPRRMALTGALFGAAGGFWLAAPAKLPGTPHAPTKEQAEKRERKFVIEPSCAVEEPATPNSQSMRPDASRARLRQYLASLGQINEGDDTVDSPGYALNLVRVPVSILPDHTSGPSIVPAVRPVRAEDDFLPPSFRRQKKQLSAARPLEDHRR